MKKLLPFLAILAIVMVACNRAPQQTIALPTVNPADTSGFAQFRAWKAQNELQNVSAYMAASQAMQQAANPPTRTIIKYYTPAGKSSSRSSSSSRGYSSSGSYTSTSSHTAVRKKGWSKAAKGAAIGAGGGAVLGAVLNKRNRVVGGVVGGILGGAIGYGLGRAGDKRDGRY